MEQNELTEITRNEIASSEKGEFIILPPTELQIG
jgi:hypothetical protein